MENELYGFASATGIETGIVRLGGMGLGNLLFSWARCAIFCKNTGARPIYTTWPQIKRHCWTAWEPDKRVYAGVFHPLPGEIHGLAKLRLLYSLPQVDEERFDSAGGAKRIVVFRDLKKYFMDIPEAEYGWIRRRFAAALRNQKLLEAKSEPHIGVHIRMGDKPKYQASDASATNMQLPLSWYVDVIKRIISEQSWTGEIGVCSDGDEESLKPILALPGVRLFKGPSALEDLIYLSQSRLLVGSYSTFSQWAAYFSGQPSVWHPGYDRKGGLGNGSLEMVMSEASAPNPAAWQACMEQLARPAFGGGVTGQGTGAGLWGLPLGEAQ